jgi:hypothetical protein
MEISNPRVAGGGGVSIRLHEQAAVDSAQRY